VVRTHLADPQGGYLLAGDEVVVSKAGKQTHGLGRFYSSIAQRPIPGLSFFALSLVDVQQRLPVTAKEPASLGGIRPPAHFQDAA